MQPESASANHPQEQLDRAESYLQSDPGNAHLLAMVIDQCLAAGAIERAQKHAQAAMALYPEDAFFQYRWGQVLVGQRKWREAEAVFAALVAVHADVNLAYSLANCQIQTGQYPAAFATLAPYSMEPELPAPAATLLVRVLHHLGDFEQASALIGRTRERYASDPVFLAAASLLQFDAGELGDAAVLSDAALAAGGHPLEALVVSGSLALSRTETDLAIARFNEALAVNPREGRSWSGLGMASLLRRDLAGAAVQLEKAVTLMPAHIGTWHALGWCKIFSQDLARAEAAFAHALALDHNFGESHGGVAVVAAIKGDRVAAVAAIDRALRLDGESLSARYAQMVLSGVAADPERFKAIAYRLLATRQAPDGESLALVVGRHVGQ